MLIALDNGHGLDTPGKRTPKFEDGTFMHEYEFNSAVVKYLDVLLRQRGISTLITSPTTENIALKVRSSLANNTIKNKYNKPVDLFISIHANAMTGAWGNPNGIETYTHPQSSKTSKEIAKKIHDYVLKGTKMTDRGLKTADFHVLRETKMPAVLLELGFMDNRHDAKLLISDNYRRECANEIAAAIFDYYNISDIAPNGTKIMGIANVGTRDMQLLLEGVNDHVEPKFDNIASIYVEICKQYGVRADIAFCQMLHETNYLRFGGDVTIDMNNFCGLGTIGGGVKGANFKTVREGVEAHIQHLFAYASIDHFIAPIIDPRFSLVSRGSATTVEQLTRKWATDKEYHTKILNILDKLNKLNSMKERDQEQYIAKVTSTKVFIEGKEVKSFNIENENYIRVAELRELGYKVDWNPEDKIVEVLK